MIGAHAALIVAEDHVHDPMEAILDTPMAAEDRPYYKRLANRTREVM